MQAITPATLSKRDSNTSAFLWHLQKILRTPIMKNICERLLLYFSLGVKWILLWVAKNQGQMGPNNNKSNWIRFIEKMILEKTHFILLVSFYNPWKHWKTRGFHCVKYVCIPVFSGPYFPSFGLNTKRYSVSLRIHSKCWRIQTRKTRNTDTFYAMFLMFSRSSERYQWQEIS